MPAGGGARCGRRGALPAPPTPAPPPRPQPSPAGLLPLRRHPPAAPPRSPPAPPLTPTRRRRPSLERLLAAGPDAGGPGGWGGV